MENEDKQFFHKVQMIREIRQRLAFMQIDKKLGLTYLQRAIEEAKEEAQKLGCPEQVIKQLLGG